jgi:hypothetical protein
VFSNRLFQEDFEQEDRGVREAGMDLSPIFPAFLLNPAWPPLVTAPPRYGNVIETAKGAKGREAGSFFPCST